MPLLLVGGCTDWRQARLIPLHDSIDGSSSFADVQKIFDNSCSSKTCHGGDHPAERLDLTVGHACGALVDQTSCLFTTRKRVVPGDPDRSYLFHKLDGSDLGMTPDGPCAPDVSGGAPVTMPYGQPKLSPSQIATIKSWIAKGAQCDGAVTDGGVDQGRGPTDGGDDDGGVNLLQIKVPDSSINQDGVPTIAAGGKLAVTVTLAGPTPVGGQTVALDVCARQPDQSIACGLAADISPLAVPSSVFVAAGQASATFTIAGVRPAHFLGAQLRAQSGRNTITTKIAVTGLALQEVFYNTAGTPDGLQWIKLQNTSSVQIDLSHYSIGAGVSSYRLMQAPLYKINLQPGQCFIVGGDQIPQSWVDEAFRFSPSIPVASSAVGVALFDQPVSSVDGSTWPIDTLVFGTNNINGLVRPNGAIAKPDIGNSTVGNSLARSGMVWKDLPSSPTTCP